MNARHLFFLLASLLPCLSTIAQAQGTYQRTRNGRTLVWNDNPGLADTATWSGKRDAEGYATGYGTLTWFRIDQAMLTGTRIPFTRHYTVVARLSGNMVRGKFSAPESTAEASPAKPNKEKPRSAATTSEKHPKEAVSRITKTSASPSPSPTASPVSAQRADDSLNSLTHPPSSLRLNPSNGSSPEPAPQAMPHPTESASPYPLFD